MSRENSRWTYARGSSPEGVVLYDDGPNGGSLKLHSHHDTDPGRGQQNAFDLVRLHKFGHLDKDVDPATPVMERPSSKAMIAFALEQPEVRAAQAGADFEVLPPLVEDSVATKPDSGVGTISENAVDPRSGGPERIALAKPIAEVLKARTMPRWLIKDIIERGVIAVMAGERGSYKSFLALDWAMTCALMGHPVYVISAEGGDFDRRAKAWLVEHEHTGEVENLPLYVVERRLDLSTKDGIERVREDCAHHKIRPVLFVLDTFSKLSGGLDENDNSKVKAFIGLLDNGLKRAYDATVLLIAHTGHTEKGRPRGASALGADTDAEYMVARDPMGGTVQVTRQRFKSSPELPPLAYQPEVVELDYQDAEGSTITSLVMQPAEAVLSGAQRVVLKKHPAALLAVARELLADCDSVAISTLLDRFVAATPHDKNVRDRRRRTGTRALDALLEKRFLVLRDAETVALMHSTRAATEEFGK